MDIQELRDFYAQSNEGELAKISSEAYDLTDTARSSLVEEIARRGLTIPLTLERKRGPVRLESADTLVELFGIPCWDIADARNAKELLNAAGIQCYWGAGKLDSPEGLDFDQGVHIAVPEADASRARLALKPLRDSAPEPQALEWVCPKCKSPDIVFQDLDETRRFHWSCDACGNEWTDDGVEETTAVS
jgi:hypothetical protein